MAGEPSEKNVNWRSIRGHESTKLWMPSSVMRIQPEMLRLLSDTRGASNARAASEMSEYCRLSDVRLRSGARLRMVALVMDERERSSVVRRKKAAM